MSLLEIENLDRTRVFPRYIPINKNYEKAEKLSASRSYSEAIIFGDADRHPDEVLSKQHMLEAPEGIIVGKLKYAGISTLL